MGPRLTPHCFHRSIILSERPLTSHLPRLFIQPARPHFTHHSTHSLTHQNMNFWYLLLLANAISCTPVPANIKLKAANGQSLSDMPILEREVVKRGPFDGARKSMAGRRRPAA